MHVLTAQTIDAALAVDLELDLMGTSVTDNVDMDALCFIKTNYLPSPFVGIFLECNFTTVETWSCLCGAIVNSGATIGCHPIID